MLVFHYVNVEAEFPEVSVTVEKLVIDVFQARSEYLHFWYSGFIEDL